MSRPKTDPDDKQCSPAVMASLLGWHRPGAHARLVLAAAPRRRPQEVPRRPLRPGGRMTIHCVHCGTVISDRPTEDINQLIARHLEQCSAATERNPR